MIARQCRPLCLCVIWGDLGRGRPPVPSLGAPSCRSSRCGNIPKALAPGALRHTRQPHVCVVCGSGHAPTKHTCSGKSTTVWFYVPQALGAKTCLKFKVGFLPTGSYQGAEDVDGRWLEVSVDDGDDR